MTFAELFGRVLQVWGVLAMVLTAALVGGLIWHGIEHSEWYIKWRAR